MYSINIVYFDLGQGENVVYEGKTEFYGLTKGDLLFWCEAQKKVRAKPHYLMVSNAASSRKG